MGQTLPAIVQRRPSATANDRSPSRASPQPLDQEGQPLALKIPEEKKKKKKVFLPSVNERVSLPNRPRKVPPPSTTVGEDWPV